MLPKGRKSPASSRPCRRGANSAFSATYAAFYELGYTPPSPNQNTADKTERDIYVENGDFGGTPDVSTFSSSFLAFFTAFFSFFACFRSPFVILDIRCGPPLAVLAAWTLRRVSQAENRGRVRGRAVLEDFPIPER
jgi:hypothetical protein